VDGVIEQSSAKAAAAMFGLQVHTFQLGGGPVVEEPYGDRTDDAVVVDGDPDALVARVWVFEIGFEHGVDGQAVLG
jgi:hypothetical protein